MPEEKQSIFTEVALEVSKQLQEIKQSFKDKDVAPVPFMKRKAGAKGGNNGQTSRLG